MNQGTGPLSYIEILHQEHREWHSEHAAWMHEIATWRREQQLAEAILYQLEHALPDYALRMAEHSKAIAAHEKHLCDYEERLPDSVIDRQQGKECVSDLVAAYRKHEKHHARDRKQHDAIRSLHHSAMVEFKRIAGLMQQIAK